MVCMLRKAFQIRQNVHSRDTCALDHESECSVSAESVSGVSSLLVVLEVLVVVRNLTEEIVDMKGIIPESKDTESLCLEVAQLRQEVRELHQGRSAVPVRPGRSDVCTGRVGVEGAPKASNEQPLSYAAISATTAADMPLTKKPTVAGIVVDSE